MEFPWKHLPQTRKRMEEHVTNCCLTKPSNNELPDDIFYEIFLRLPVKTLLRFRSISRNWRVRIDSVAFASMHISTQVAIVDADAEEPQPQLLPVSCSIRDNIVHSCFYDGKVIKQSERPVLEFSEECSAYVVRHAAYGLLLYCNPYSNMKDLVICNPLRGELLTLPPPLSTTVASRGYGYNLEESYTWYGIGFDCTTTCYKIVLQRLWILHNLESSSLSEKRLETYVYTLGSNSWREISSPLCFKPSYDEYAYQYGVSAYGDVHWKYWINEDKIKGILSFDFKREEFKDTPLPDFGCQYKHYNKFKLIDLKGFLAVVSFPTFDHIDIWVLKDYIKKEWVREYRTSTRVWTREPDNNGATVGPDIDFWRHKENLVYVCGRGIVIDFLKRRYVFVLDLDTNCIRPLQRRKANRYISYTGSVLTLKNFGNPIANIFSRHKFLKNACNFYVSPLNDIMERQ